jgi:hypothetical protein
MFKLAYQAPTVESDIFEPHRLKIRLITRTKNRGSSIIILCDWAMDAHVAGSKTLMGSSLLWVRLRDGGGPRSI